MNAAAATAIDPIFVAAAEGEPMAAVVSLHDVAPATWRQSQEILEKLETQGVKVCSLLVVPDYHHDGRSVEHREFVSWLRGLEADGHEVVLHGYFHQRARRTGETLRAKWITRVYTNDEGEFYDLAYAEALRRIERGRDELRDAGLKPHGFIAPAWLLGPEAERAAVDAGMEYTTRLTSVRDLRSGEEVAARSLVYSVRNSWRRGVSLAWNAALFRRLTICPLLRLSIHPPDIDQPEVWRQICRFAREIGTKRKPTTYGGWINQRRSQTPSV